MPNQITLPECLLSAYQQMYPTLDFSRIRVYDGIVWPLSWGTENGITVTSFPDHIDIYLKDGLYDPCKMESFAVLGHELVHALQIEQGYASGWFDSWILSYATAYLGAFGRDKVNPYEAEAYDMEAKIRSCGFVPCDCGGRGVMWMVPAADIPGHLQHCGLVKQAPKADWTQAYNSTIKGISDDFPVFGSLWFFISFIISLIVTIIYFIVDAIVSLIKTIVNFIGDLFSHDKDGSLNVLFSQDDGLTFGNKITFGRSSEVPALAFDASHLFVGWTGTDNRVNVMRAPNPSIVTFEKSNDDGPALAFGNGRVFVAWEGTDNRLNVMSSADGQTFANKVTLGETSKDNAAPGLAVVDGRVYLSWIGTDNRINILSSADGMNWGAKLTLGETSGDDATPALAGGNGRLFLAWAGTDDAHSLNVLTLSHDGNGNLGWIAKVTLQETATRKSGPALAFGNGKLFLAWTGQDDELNVLSTADGQNFGDKRTFELSSNDCGPGLAYGQGTLCIAWVGQQ
jgi:hypothetical protein